MTDTSRGTQEVDVLALAGMVDPGSGLIGVTSVTVGEPLLPPYLRLERDELVWSLKSPAGKRVRLRQGDTRGMLDAFVRIRDGDEALRFAQRYGVLGICEHGLPASHNPPPFFPGLGHKQTWCYPRGLTGGLAREPVERWLRFARQANSLSRIAAAAHRNEAINPDDWRIVFEDFEDMTAAPENLDAARANLTMLLDQWWLPLGNVRPSFSWLDGPEPAFRLRSGGYAFGVLAVQLMMAVGNAHALALCSGCGNVYMRQGRKPQAGRRNYCPECLDRGVPARDRQRDSRARRGGWTSADPLP